MTKTGICPKCKKEFKSQHIWVVSNRILSQKIPTSKNRYCLLCINEYLVGKGLTVCWEATEFIDAVLPKKRKGG